MQSQPIIPVNVMHLLPVLDSRLMELLRSLTPHEWQMQTVAKLWKVKDVAAHLLDINMRVISSTDGFTGEAPPAINSTRDLVDYLNTLNADWVNAMKRVSPQMLILLHEITGPMFCEIYASADMMAKAPFAVDWAGESESKNWMHIAREYTEKFLHQQQIRDAVNKPGLMTPELFYPFIDIFMMALPHTYRDVNADDGTAIQITVTGDIGGTWHLTRFNGKWVLGKNAVQNAAAAITIDPDTAWKLFSKSLRSEQVMDKINITGNQKLGETALGMISVMA
ncbi:maleylpyruvate isomerase N-terminal domain-containing protein [Mucilaginibacter sp. AW1-3]